MPPRSSPVSKIQCPAVPPWKHLSEQIAERPEVQIEIAILDSELTLELLHSLLELNEGAPQPVDLVIGQRALLQAAKRLALHHLPQELDERKDELRQASFPLLGIGVDPPRECAAEAI